MEPKLYMDDHWKVQQNACVYVYLETKMDTV